MKKIVTGIGAIVFTIALTGMVKAAGLITLAQQQSQTQVQGGDQGSSTNMDRHNGDHANNGGQPADNSGSNTNKKKQSGNDYKDGQHGDRSGSTGNVMQGQQGQPSGYRDMQHMNRGGQQGDTMNMGGHNCGGSHGGAGCM